MTTPIDPDFLALIESVLSGDAGASEMDQLERILREDASAWQTYRDYCEMHAELRFLSHGKRGLEKFVRGVLREQEAAPAPSAPAPTARAESTRGQRTKIGWLTPALLIAAAACLVLLVAIGNRMPRDGVTGTGGALAVREDNRPVATITGLFGVFSEQEQTEKLHVGQALHVGERVLLAGGVAEIAFATGPVAVLQGPAELSIDGMLGATLRRGRIVVRVTEDIDGFVIRSPEVDVVDHGTEFGVQVEPSGVTTVQVYDGEVDVVPASKERLPASKRLRAGDAVRAKRPGHRDPLSLEPQMPEDALFLRSLPDVSATDGASSREGRHWLRDLRPVEGFSFTPVEGKNLVLPGWDVPPNMAESHRGLTPVGLAQEDRPGVMIRGGDDGSLGTIVHGVTTGPRWVLEFQFATMPPEEAGTRGLNVLLHHAKGDFVNLRVGHGGAIYVYEGDGTQSLLVGEWRVVSPWGAVSFSEDRNGDGSLSDPEDVVNVHTLRLVGDYGEDPSFDIYLSEANNPEPRLVASELKIFQNGPPKPGAGLRTVRFQSYRGPNGDYVIDRVRLLSPHQDVSSTTSPRGVPTEASSNDVSDVASPDDVTPLTSDKDVPAVSSPAR
ncbi:FecR protein [Planctomycetes bacterium Pan216]|uniref:FecR protein n=1 Tax=Kolteria novifilia TaxID=2527975 RepID=A0A518B7C9_9BACT|nr:FecR protein [Planctomycetes bacterium Pan216]